MTRYDFYIGIDPDSIKSGIAIVSPQENVLQCDAMHFADIIGVFRRFAEMKETMGSRILVVVEAGWLNENNWHLRFGDNLRVASAKGRAIGRCEQTGILILEMAGAMGLECKARKPLAKFWKGKDRKITHEEIKALTGVERRTNQEMRDALLLAWVEAGSPSAMKPKPKDKPKKKKKK